MAEATYPRPFFRPHNCPPGAGECIICERFDYQCVNYVEGNTVAQRWRTHTQHHMANCSECRQDEVFELFVKLRRAAKYRTIPTTELLAYLLFREEVMHKKKMHRFDDDHFMHLNLDCLCRNDEDGCEVCERILDMDKELREMENQVFQGTTVPVFVTIVE